MSLIQGWRKVAKREEAPSGECWRHASASAEGTLRHENREWCGVWGGVSPPSQLWDLGERRELPQLGLGQSPGQKHILDVFLAQNTSWQSKKCAGLRQIGQRSWSWGPEADDISLIQPLMAKIWEARASVMPLYQESSCGWSKFEGWASNFYFFCAFTLMVRWQG